MKKLLILSSLIVGCSLASCGKDGAGRTSLDKGLTYELDSETNGYIVSYNGKREQSLLGRYTITIPEKHNGKPVTKIAENGFSNIDGLEIVNIPDTIVDIGAFAFKGCTSLVSAPIPSKVTILKESIFEHTSIWSLTIPEGVTEIKSNAFSLTHLKEISIPKNVVLIEAGAFSYNSNLLKINIDQENSIYETMDSNIIVEKNTGKMILGTRGMTFPSTLSLIGSYAFKGISFTYDKSDHSYVQPLYIPATILYIEKNAFTNCKYLTLNCEAEEQPEGWEEGWQNNNEAFELHFGK